MAGEYQMAQRETVGSLAYGTLPHLLPRMDMDIGTIQTYVMHGPELFISTLALPKLSNHLFIFRIRLGQSNKQHGTYSVA